MIKLTNTQLEELLYSGTTLEFENIRIFSWFDDANKEKNIDICRIKPWKEVNIIINGMTILQLNEAIMAGISQVQEP